MNGMIGYKIFTDNYSPIKEFGDTGIDALAGFVWAEFPYSSSQCWREIFAKVHTGATPNGYQGTGNAYSVWQTNDLIYLMCEYVDDQRVCLTYNQIIDVLDHHDIVLEELEKSANYKPESFEVEYLAEGDQAEKYYENHGGVFERADEQ